MRSKCQARAASSLTSLSWRLASGAYRISSGKLDRWVRALARLRRLRLEMAEHEIACFVIHFGLEREFVLQRDRSGRRRPSRNLIHQPFYVSEFRKRIVSEHEWRQTRPAPQRHVHDRIGLADHVAATGKMVVENAVMTLRLERIAVLGIFQLGRRVMPEMHGLARIGADPARDEHQPREQLGAIGG